MRAAAKRILKDKQAQEYQPLPGFSEHAPGVWIPQGYRPGKLELPTPIVRTAEDVAVEYARCARSLKYFVFSSCWSLHTDDPAGPTYRKFPAYPYLIDFFTRVQTPENVHEEKSRQLLQSWAWMAVFLWDILFHDAWADLAVSKSEKHVDDDAKSETDSLFGKLHVIWRSLPPHLQHPLEFRHLRITCPATHSYVRGVSGATAGGRGASYKRALLDEAAHIPRGEALFRAVHEAAKHGLVLLSTPMGKGNVFARIRFQPRTTFRRLSYHWSHHPDKAQDIYCECGWKADATIPQKVKTWRQQFEEHVCLPGPDVNDRPRRHARSPWYDTATADYTPEQIASEFDLSYEKSMRGRVYAPFDATRHCRPYTDAVQADGTALGLKREHETAPAYRRRYLRAVLDPRLTTVVGWDFGVGDPTSLSLGQVTDDRLMKIRWLDEYEKNDASWDHFMGFIQGLWAPIWKDLTACGSCKQCLAGQRFLCQFGRDLLHYGDPSGKNRNASLESWTSNLDIATRVPVTAGPFVGAMFPIKMIIGPKQGEFLEWLDFIANLIRKGQFEVSEWCAHMMDALGQYHFPLDADGNPVPGVHNPVHDEWSHQMDGMRYVYQFRWSNRLKDIGGNVASAKSILSVGADDKNTIAPKDW